MGTQGEIYAMLGVKLPAKEISSCGLYEVNGKKVAVDDLVSEPHEFVHGVDYTFSKRPPELSVYILGFDSSYGMSARHFKGEALVGYTIANESYVNSATKLPSFEVIDSLKIALAKDLEEKLNYFPEEKNKIGLYLLFDFIN